jgi:hypothetical protein
MDKRHSYFRFAHLGHRSTLAGTGVLAKHAEKSSKIVPLDASADAHKRILDENASNPLPGV